MSEKIYPVPEAVRARAHIDDARYQAMYARSVQDPAGFWAEQAKEFIDWMSPWTNVMRSDMPAGRVAWFESHLLQCLKH